MGARVRAVIVLSVTAGLLAVVGALPAFAASPPRQYYVALGDSLSQGAQPTPQGVTVPTKNGYVNQLYALKRRQVPRLRLVNLGCGGETTASMITGKGNPYDPQGACAKKRGGSQLKGAVAFLKSHPRDDIVLTLDIGGNDITSCLQPNLTFDPACTANVLRGIGANFRTILSTLRRAGGRETEMAVMNAFDPFLASYLRGEVDLAIASLPLVRQFNSTVASAARASRFRVADVADAFNTFSTATVLAPGGQQLPLSVLSICQYTYMCYPPPQGPNPHATTDGYAVMARVFADTLGRLSFAR